MADSANSTKRGHAAAARRRDQGDLRRRFGQRRSRQACSQHCRHAAFVKVPDALLATVKLAFGHSTVPQPTVEDVDIVLLAFEEALAFGAPERARGTDSYLISCWTCVHYLPYNFSVAIRQIRMP